MNTEKASHLTKYPDSAPSLQNAETATRVPIEEDTVRQDTAMMYIEENVYLSNLVSFFVERLLHLQQTLRDQQHHTADILIRLISEDLKPLFEQSNDIANPKSDET